MTEYQRAQARIIKESDFLRDLLEANGRYTYDHRTNSLFYTLRDDPDDPNSEEYVMRMTLMVSKHPLNLNLLNREGTHDMLAEKERARVKCLARRKQK